MKRPHIPYFKFYPSDFMNGVRGLSAQEVGVYTMILCRIYEDAGPVEYNILRLSTYCGMRENTFKNTLDKLVNLGKLEHENGMIFNTRAMAEISSRSDDLKNSSRAGKASAEKRQQNQQKNPTGVQRAFNHTDTDTDTVYNSLSVVIINEKKQTGIEQFKSILSPHIREDILRDFCNHRKVKKAAFSETAAKMFLKAAHDCGMTPNQAAATAIERNWITVKPEWLKNSNRGSEPRTIAEAAAKASAERKRNEQQSIFDAVEPETGNSIRHNRSLGVLDRLAEPKLPD